jgi:hypothetical protein
LVNHFKIGSFLGTKILSLCICERP